MATYISGVGGGMAPPGGGNAQPAQLEAALLSKRHKTFVVAERLPLLYSAKELKQLITGARDQISAL